MGLNLAATISLDGSQFERGMQRVGASAASGIKNLVAGAVGVYALEEAFRKTIDTADELVTTSRRLGVGVEQLQILSQAAKDAGVDLAAVTTGLEKMGQARAMALGQGLTNSKLETAGYMNFFAKLGVSPEMVKSGGSEAIMAAIAQKVKDTANPQSLIEPLREIFGKAGGALIPLFQENLEELGKKMKDMGAIMDTTSAVELKAFKDEMNLISTIIVSSLAPALVAFGRGLLLSVDKIKGAADYYGGATSKMSWSDIFKIATGLGTPTLPENKLGLAAMAQDKDSALDKFDAMVKNIREQIENPKKPVFTQEEGSLKGNAKKETKIESDSLTKVGNFLGTSRSAIDGAQQQMAVHAEQTASNTAKTVDILNAMLGAIIGTSGKTVGQIESIFFPNN